MGSDAFNKVQTGQKLRIPAEAFNSFIDAALAYKTEQAKSIEDRRRELVNPSVILVKNTMSADLDKYQVGGLSSPMILPSESEEGFLQSDAAFNLVSPNRTTAAGAFVVTQEVIPAGKTGLALISGVTPVRIQYDAGSVTEMKFAEVISGDSTRLKAGQYGSATILYREGGTGEQWALVRLGPRTRNYLFPVNLLKAGGAGGDESSPATWTYHVTDAILGGLIATFVDPTASPSTWKRPAAGTMSIATAGLAFYDDNGVLALAWINEVAEQEVCS